MDDIEPFYYIIMIGGFALFLVCSFTLINYVADTSQPRSSEYICTETMKGIWIDNFGPNSCLVCTKESCIEYYPREYKGKIAWVESK